MPQLASSDYRLGGLYPNVPDQMQDFEVPTPFARQWTVFFQVSRQCLELYGVDFVVDPQLKPWILEVLLVGISTYLVSVAGSIGAGHRCAVSSGGPSPPQAS